MVPARFPTHRRGVRPGRISGILHVLKFGCRWRDCPAVYGPHTTIYNRFNRWSKSGIWQRILQQLITPETVDLQSIDSTTAKAHRCSGGGKGGPICRRSGAAEAAERRKSTPLPTAAGV
ncbi:transposase [Rhodopila sp.]|uniref:transposase n=1 Tax=Rhodopila sp. TaxID=2480087 RepID=UPI003D0B235A